MASASDRDGQPANQLFNARRRHSRDVDELLGLCRGLAADGSINDAEARFLRDWLFRHEELTHEWPGDLLAHRLQMMLSDDVLDLQEGVELLKFIVSLTGGESRALNAANLTAGLPLNDPPPSLQFQGNSICFTGKFLLGPRRVCEGFAADRGAVVEQSVSKGLKYLVIGVVGSRDWIHSSYGRKIEQAVELRAQGLPLAIVSEEHFARAIS